MEAVTDTLCRSLWGGDDCAWVFLPSKGNSGCILSVSSSNIFFSFVGEGFLGVCLDWGVTFKRIFIVNIYSKSDLMSKRRLWEVRRGFMKGAWSLVGDFNAVCSREERRGVNEMSSTSNLFKINLFNNCLRDLEVEDLNILGHKFTWYHPNGRTMSRIDRILVSEGWRREWEAMEL